MTPQTAVLPVPVPLPTRRLLIGLALSFALHLALLLAFGTGPGPARYVVPRPLQVEIRHVAEPQPKAPAELAVEQPPAELSSEPVAVAPPEARPQEPVPPAPREAAPGIELPFDKYFTSRELDVRAEQINEVDLVYPSRAYQMRTRGKVVLRMFINERGGIDEVTILESAPPGVFEEAALTAALALQFKPAIKNGRDVKSQKTIEVIFDPYESINIP